MKKIFSIAACSLALAGLISCGGGGDKKAAAPSFSWEDNNGFGSVEISKDLKADVTIEVPGKVQSLTINFTYPAVEMNSILNQKYTSSTITLGSKSCTFDLVADSKSWSGFGLTSSARNLTKVVLKFAPMLAALTDETVIKGLPSSDFTYQILIEDQNGKTGGKTAKFHWTPAPSVTWTGISGVSAEIAAKNNASFAIDAPGKIETFDLKITSANSEFAAWLATAGATSAGGVHTLSLVGNNKASIVAGLPAEKDIVGKTSIKSFSLETMIKYLETCAPTDNTVITFEITDALGKSGSFSATYLAPAAK